MKIGIISDTHDHWTNIEKFVDKFIDEEKVEVVFHCGDIIAPFMKKPFNRLNENNIPLYAVYGNNDGEREGLKNLFGKTFEIKGNFLEIELSGKKILMFHHLEMEIVDAIAKSEKYDLILKGHTHQVMEKKIGKTLIVNPGEACGYLTKNSTAAVLNLDDMNLRFLKL